MIKYIKYIRKDIENIHIPPKSEKYDRYNPRYWKIALGETKWTISSVNYCNYDTFTKKFFVFVYTGDKFPYLTKNKEGLAILKKYKFSKIYTSDKSGITCHYFKRGMLFHTQYLREDDKKILTLKRLFKLLKLKDNGN